MVIEKWLGYPLPEKYYDIEKCSMKEEIEGHSQLEPRDYTYYLLFVTVYLLVLILVYMFFFKTELRRTIAGNMLSVKKETVDDNDVESLLPGGLTMVRVVSRKRLVTC